MNILQKIIAESKIQLEQRKKDCPIEILEKTISEREKKIVSFSAAFRDKNKVNIISELKKASPSKGLIRENFEPKNLAIDLEKNGAAALSVLTEENYFLGSRENLIIARKFVDIPILRKDFFYDKYQIIEAKALGADAILLIAAALDTKQLKELYDFAYSIGLEVLFETHSEAEIEVALEIDAHIIGINSRNLKTFEVDLEQTAKMLDLIPNHKVKIMESGIKTPDDIRKINNMYEFNGFLIGETLMRKNDVGSFLKELINANSNNI
ncbi:indole-3-glycerol phosphate synthase TrpC [Lentisphaerota bacterium WC36G]|nr:indole-3-glycerol phosphate synthase TrpC [Lentisphaerae bacterium WC36]